LNDRDQKLRSRLESIKHGDEPPSRIVPLAGDASTRAYFRTFYSDQTTKIFMVQQNPGQNEEAQFLDVHGFLKDLGFAIPRIHYHDAEQGIIVLEDLGDDLLETVVDRIGIEPARHLYEQAVDLLLTVRHATDGLNSGCCAFDLAFDQAKLMEEMRFFLMHFVQGMCGMTPSTEALTSLEQFFTGICSMLGSEPRFFTHRDFHSRNLILHNKRLFMIDFQDARMGPAQYDLASLLRDSYVTLPEKLVDEMLYRYLDGARSSDRVSADMFRYVFDVMCLQRNIKALGTFGYQSTIRGSTRYLSSIPRTRAYVARNIARYPEFGPYRSVVEDFIIEPAIALTTTDR